MPDVNTRPAITLTCEGYRDISLRLDSDGDVVLTAGFDGNVYMHPALAAAVAEKLLQYAKLAGAEYGNHEDEPDEEPVEEKPTGQFRARMNDSFGFGTGNKTAYGVQTADRFTLVLQDGYTPVKLGRIEDHASNILWLDC